jgi:hypothetical protein
MGFLDVVQVALDSGDDFRGWPVADFGAAVVFERLVAVGGVAGFGGFAVFGGGFAVGGLAWGVIEAVEEEDGSVHGAGDAGVGAGCGVGVEAGGVLGFIEDTVGEFDAFEEEVLAQGAELRRVIERLEGWGRCRRWGWVVEHERIMNTYRIAVNRFCDFGLVGSPEPILCPS